MGENYKHLYKQTKKMLTMYQDELVPGFRKKIEELEKNHVDVRCKDCIFCHYNSSNETYKCSTMNGMYRTVQPNEFCSYGERKCNDG